MSAVESLVLRNLSDPTTRAVAEDYATEHARFSPAAWLVRMGLLPANADADAYADAYADADAYANADAYADADAYANANADADAYANANAYADAYAYANAGRNQLNLAGGKHMRSGLYFWAQPNGGVVVLRLGWIRRVEGDEYEAQHMVTPLRNGDYTTLFDSLAIDGPPKEWKFSRPMPRPSPLNRFHVLGPISLDPTQWSGVCPRPKNWSEE